MAIKRLRSVTGIKKWNEKKKKDEEENLWESNESMVNIKHVADRAKLSMSFHMGGTQYN